MGEFTNDDSNYKNIQKDQEQKFGEEIEDGFATDVEGLKSDGVVKYGQEQFPRFDVTPEEFFSNQRFDRKRLRFKKASKAGEYMRKTKNGARPFYIKTTTSDGKTFMNKVR